MKALIWLGLYALPFHLDPGIAIWTRYDLVGDHPFVFLSHRVVVTPTDQALDRENGVFGIGDALSFGGLTDQDFAAIGKGDLGAALGHFQRSHSLRPSSWALGHIGHTLARLGRVEEARQVIGELQAMSAKVSPEYELALIHAALQDKDRAFAALDRACADLSPALLWVKVDFLLDELRRGAAGNMPAAHAADALVSVWNAWAAGNEAEAQALHDRLLPLLNYERCYGGSVVYKEVLRRRGIIRSSAVRSPTPPLDAPAVRELERILANVGGLFNV